MSHPLPHPPARRRASPTPSSRRLLLLVPFLLLALLHARRRAPEPRLLWLTPRSGGFNNQLITVYEGILCARRHARTVVLPLIYENVRADTSSKGVGPFPFEHYFDVAALRRVVRLTTPAALDSAPPPCAEVLFASSPHFKANDRRVPRLLKQQYARRFALNHTFVHRFPDRVGAPCVDDSLCSRDVFRPFGPYSDYARSGQGYSIRHSPALRHIRAAFKPSATVVAIADIMLEIIGAPFNAMHVRRGDFHTKCEELPKICHQFGRFSVVQSRVWIMTKVAQFKDPSLPVFISTTHKHECETMLQGTGLQMRFMEEIVLPDEYRWASNRTDIISFASQVVASRAQEFIGNRFSSYTTEINNMRYLRDRNDRLNFF